MSVAIICDKCHKNAATQMLKDRHGNGKLIFLCDECAGVEPPKSVTYSSEAERKKRR